MGDLFAPLSSHRAIEVLRRLILEHGVSPEAVTARVQHPLKTDQDGRLRIPVLAFCRLWQMAIELARDESLGLSLISHYRSSDAHFVTMLAMQSETYGEAARVWCRYARLVCEADELELVRLDDQRVAVVYRFGFEPPLGRYVSEHYAAMAVAYGRQMLGSHFSVLEAAFTYSAPAYADRYEEVLGCPVRFDAAQTRMVFHEQVMSRQLPAADVEMRLSLGDLAETRLKQAWSEMSRALACERVLWRKLSVEHEAAKAQVAKALGVSSRTLQRQLEREGTTFREVRESVLRRAAQRYLQEPLAIGEIAALLGYKEASSFQHAFRRWFDCTPSQMRRDATHTSGAQTAHTQGVSGSEQGM
ncbi:MAG: AraC family transcriptional regulator [Myxococcota bacterium]